MKSEIEELIRQAARNLNLEVGKFEVEYPATLEHGDYASNVALVVAKQAKQNPRQLAEALVNELEKIKTENLNRIEVAGPGFINFYLAPKTLARELEKILARGELYGSNNLSEAEKVLVEYTQPNPFKEFHIGHLMNNVIGEALSRLIESSGATVARATYHGDVGMHVAKTIWGLQQAGAENLSLKLLGEAYASGHRAFEDDPSAKEAIMVINKKIYDRSDKQINHLYDAGRTCSLEAFESLYRRLGSQFNFHFFESEAGPLGLEVVRSHPEIFELSEGAMVFRGENYGLHTRVFVNSQGLPTYEAKELGLQELKRQKFSATRSVTVTAVEQKDFFRVVRQAIELIYPELAGKLDHVAHGFLRLPSGKMSSRTGTVVAAESLLGEVADRAAERMADRPMSEVEKALAVEAVALGAIKYVILKQSPGRDIVFDFDTALSFEGDSGPYLQYTYVRAKSVLAKAEVPPTAPKETDSELARLLGRFPELVARASAELSPQHVVTYVTELASAFNSYYAQNKIIGSVDESAQLALVAATAQVLKNGLKLLGIPVPEKM